MAGPPLRGEQPGSSEGCHRPHGVGEQERIRAEGAASSLVIHFWSLGKGSQRKRVIGFYVPLEGFEVPAGLISGRFRIDMNRALQPREGEPRQPNKAYQGDY